MQAFDRMGFGPEHAWTSTATRSYGEKLLGYRFCDLEYLLNLWDPMNAACPDAPGLFGLLSLRGYILYGW